MVPSYSVARSAFLDISLVLASSGSLDVSQIVARSRHVGFIMKNDSLFFFGYIGPSVSRSFFSDMS